MSTPPPPAASAASLANDAYRLLMSSGARHERQLGELAAAVESCAALGNETRLPEAIEALQACVEGLQLGTAEARGDGWLARLRGTHGGPRDALAAQGRQFEIERGLVEAATREAAAQWAAQAGVTRRMLVDFVVEAQALERTLVGVAKLLRDAKRAARKEHTLAETGVAHLELAALAKRTETLHARLRQSEALTRTANQVHQLAQDIAVNRGALAKLLQDDLARKAARFHESLQRLLATPPSATAATGDARELAAENLRNLQLWLAQTGATCIRLQHQEHQAAHAFAKLHGRAAAVAAKTGRR